jgi:hypothetical protein
MRGSFALGALGWQVALADIANVRILKSVRLSAWRKNICRSQRKG